MLFPNLFTTFHADTLSCLALLAEFILFAQTVVQIYDTGISSIFQMYSGAHARTHTHRDTHMDTSKHTQRGLTEMFQDNLI